MQYASERLPPRTEHMQSQVARAFDLRLNGREFETQTASATG